MQEALLGEVGLRSDIWAGRREGAGIDEGLKGYLMAGVGFNRAGGAGLDHGVMVVLEVEG